MGMNRLCRHVALRLAGRSVRLLAALALLQGILLGAAVWANARSAAVEAAQKTSLWAVEGGANRVFLLGSIHYLRQDAYPLPPAIESAYAQSRLVVFETDVARMQDSRVQDRMLELGMYPQGQSVFQDLGAETRRKLEQRLSASGLPLEVVAAFKPWMVALTLSSLEFMRLGFDPGLGVDMHFYQRAGKDGKQLAALEPVEFQIQLLAGMDAHAQEAFLTQTLDELDEAPRLAAGILGLWRDGRSEDLYRLLFKSIDRHPEVRDRMLDRRNRAWLETIEDLIRRDEAALVIVGAMHLIGPGSVIDLLQSRGHRVEQR
jgi:uncharacterized protein YbaP (TraB family)